MIIMTARIDQLNTLATSPPPFSLDSVRSSGGAANLFFSLGLELGLLTRVKKGERKDRSGCHWHVRESQRFRTC